MRALFCYDGPLKEDKNGNYYGIALNNNMFSRYFLMAESINAVISTQKINQDEEMLNKYSKISLNNFEIISIPKLASFKSLLFNRKSIKDVIYKELKESDFLIVRLPSVIGNISIEIAKTLNKPYFVEVVGCPWDAYWNHSFKGKLFAFPSYWSMKRSVKSATYALYVTNQFLQNRYQCNGETIGCSDVSLPKSSVDVLEKRLQKIRDMRKEVPIILGTIAAVNVKYKGQEFVIKAISKLKEISDYNFEYHIVGGGDQSYLSSIAKKYGVLDKIKFLGTLQHEDIYKYLDSIDLYIQPSKTEGLPRALIEAMSRGCPSFGSNVGGIPELLSEKFMFRKASVDQLCDLLKTISKDELLKEAERGFIISKSFNKESLDEKRSLFYKRFQDYLKTLP